MQLLLFSPIIFLIFYIASRFRDKPRKRNSTHNTYKSNATRKQHKSSGLLGHQNNNKKPTKKIPYKTGNGLWKIEDFTNYVFYNKKNDEHDTHPGITIDKNNDNRAIIQLTSSKRTSGRNNMPISNIDGKSQAPTYVNTELKTKRCNNNKKGPITDKHIRKTKNVYRTLSEKECHDILDRINNRQGNINRYNEFITDKKE